MKWEVARRLLVVAGIAYLVVLIPANLRPSWNASPLRKADQTITLQADTPGGALGPTARDAVKGACKAQWFLKPIMSSASKVRALATWNGKVVGVHDYKCASLK